MKITLNGHLLFTCFIICTLFSPSTSLAWVGIELDSGLTAAPDPYEVPGGGEGGVWEISGRAMLSESRGPVDAEAHWLLTALGSFGDRPLPFLIETSPFRSLDLEDVHHSGGRSALISEFDRLALTLNRKNVRLTAGRQAVSWGEAYYYNIGDLFGAFPITETNRTYKPGVDALAATISIGLFSDLSLVYVPSDDRDDSLAALLRIPVGTGSLTLTAGSVLESAEAGAGYTVDVEGTRIYGTWLFTSPENGDGFSELVLGGERQTGPYTHVVGELYYSGWGADDPGEYAALLQTERYLDGRVLSIGRFGGVVQVSRQLSPLITVTPAVFANLSDGSALTRIDGSYSASDLTSVRAGLFLGLGERTDGAFPGSEFGAVPPTVYIEVVHTR